MSRASGCKHLHQSTRIVSVPAVRSDRAGRSVPEPNSQNCSILEAGIVALALPTDFTRIGSTACASCQQLKLLTCPKLRITAKEAFLKRTSPEEVSTPALHGAFFPRVRTLCGHGAQVIVEGREKQSDGGEKNKDHNHNPKTTTKDPLPLNS